MTKMNRVGIACMLVLGLAARTAQAETYYWDTDGITGGFGDAAGTWGTSVFWSTNSAGASDTALTTITTSDGIHFGTATLALGSTAAAVAVSGSVTVNSITFGAAQATAVTLSGGTSITLGGTTPTITVNNAADTISTVFDGSAGLTKAGTGTLTLSGNNSYSGVTSIGNGILAIAHNNALGNTAGNTTVTATGSNTGPLLRLSGNITSPENISITGNTEQNNWASVIYNTSGTNTLSGPITLASPTGGIRLGSGAGELIFGGTISQTGTSRALVLQAYTAAALTVNNAIANNNGPLSVINPGAVTLKGASTAIGATTVGEGGLLKLGVKDALKTSANLTIGFAYNFLGSDQGIFDLAGFDQTVSALIGTKNTSNVGADSTRKVTNSATGTNTLTVGNGNGAGTFNGVIQDGGVGKIVALTKIGTGTQTLVGDSNYSGVTTISVGTIAISHANALGTTAGNTTIAATGSPATGGTLSLSGGITSPENITITGRTEVGGGYNPVITGSGTLSGTIALSSLTGGVRFGGVTFSGTIQQTGSSQALVLSGTTVNNPINNNAGMLQVLTSTAILKGVSGSGIGQTQLFQNGVLQLGVTDAINTAADLDIGTYGSENGTFNLAGFNQTVRGLISGSTGTARKVINSVASTTSILTVGNGGGNYTFSGTILNNNGTGGTVALVKTGGGSQTLSGTNTYTGATTVNDGTLLIKSPGSLHASSAVAVDGGTLTGNGTVNGLVTVGALGSIAPGDSVGTLSIGGLNVSAMANGGTGKLKFDLDAPPPAVNNDKIAVTGTLTIGSGVLGLSDFVFTKSAGFGVGTYTLITSGGINPGDTLHAADCKATINGLTQTLQINGNSIELDVRWAGTLIRFR